MLGGRASPACRAETDSFPLLTLYSVSLLHVVVELVRIAAYIILVVSIFTSPILSLHVVFYPPLLYPALRPGALAQSPGREAALALEAAQGAPRDPRRDSRGERSPWLPLETRPDSPGEPGMQPRTHQKRS